MNDPQIKLADIAGYQEEKAEAAKIIHMLRNAEAYREKGATIPKGLLLSGDPGVGKTMFAKAIASEAGVPFFEFDYAKSDGEEQAIASIRELFEKAKENAPCVLFIDELGELVTQEDPYGYNCFRSDYSRKMLKTLLTEMDGIRSPEGVFVIAATNDKKSSPAALIRSGRLERQITLGLPSYEDRAAIAELYLKSTSCNIDPGEVAKKTNGLTGADIKSLVNLGIIESVRNNCELSMEMLDVIIPTIRFGEIKKNDGGFKEPVCFHEIGHFLTQYHLKGVVGSISLDRYGTVEGRVESDDSDDERKRTEEACRSADDRLNDVTILLGGIAAENVFLGKKYCGSYSDISSSIDIIQSILYSGALGFEAMFPFERRRYHGKGMITYISDSDPEYDTQKQIVIDILNRKLSEATWIVNEHKELGYQIAELIKEKGSLSAKELEAVITECQPA